MAVTRSDAWRDALLGVGVAVLGCLLPWALAQSDLWYPSTATLRSYQWAAVALGLTLALHRSHPVACAVVAFLPYPLLMATGAPTLLHHLPVAFAAYALVRSGAAHWVVALLGAGVATLLLFLSGLPLPEPVASWLSDSWVSDLAPGLLWGPYWTVDPSELAQLLAVAGFAVALGAALRRLETVRAELERRNAELLALQGVEAERAVTAERNRISRDLHDIVAHHVTAIVVRAQAALHVSRTAPDKAMEALAWIVGEGKESLAAMRSMVSMLHTDAEADEDLPVALSRVADRLRSGGLDVTLTSPPSLPGLSPAARQAALRIAQEALTNVALHSRAGTATVRLAEAPGSLRMEVSDPGPAVGAGSGRDGNGLRHMRERAEGVGGRIVAGPHGEGWRVAVELRSAP